MSDRGAALLTMDFQPTIVARTGDPTVVARSAAAAAAARAAGVLVVHVRLAFRPGHPEVSPRNLQFAPIAEQERFLDGSPTAWLVPELEPAPGDVVVVKKRVSAFAGSDLHDLLRAQAIDSLALAGVFTGGVVLSTLRAAADLDYRLTVLADACADADPDVHAMLLEKVFPAQAEVTTVDAWAEAVRA